MEENCRSKVCPSVERKLTKLDALSETFNEKVAELESFVDEQEWEITHEFGGSEVMYRNLITGRVTDCRPVKKRLLRPEYLAQLSLQDPNYIAFLKAQQEEESSASPKIPEAVASGSILGEEEDSTAGLEPNSNPETLDTEKPSKGFKGKGKKGGFMTSKSKDLGGLLSEHGSESEKEKDDEEDENLNLVGGPNAQNLVGGPNALNESAGVNEEEGSEELPELSDADLLKS